MKILVLGHARHGKDTVCEILRDCHGLKFESTSYFCAERIIFPALRDRYNTIAECYNARSSNRAEWFNLIKEYNTPDKSRLLREVFAYCDIYCGLRNADELLSLREEGHRQVTSVWVEREIPAESLASNTIDSSMADYVIYNNGTIEDLKEKVSRFYHSL